MKPEDIVTVINIDHKWMEWQPRKGPYAGMTKYICFLLGNSLGYSGGYVQCIIAGFKHEDRNMPHMHLGTITGYQLENNTKPLSDSKLREQFEEMFKEFKKTWQEKQVLKKAKALLMQK